MRRLLQALLALVTIWALSIATIFVLKSWGPIQALFKETHNGTYLEASGYLAALIILVLVFMYVLVKILASLPLPAPARAALTTIHTALSQLFLGS